MPRSNTSARMLPHPAIEDGNRSFPQGDYWVRREPSGNSDTGVILHHKLEGAPFIQKLIEEGKAKFACLVSVPKTGYRKLDISENSEQKISWNSDIVGEPPWLGPCILYVGEDLEGGTWAQGDGVAESWLNQGIYIPKGARLAKGRYLRPSSEIGHTNMLHAKKDGTMKSGTFKVEPNSNDGFSFSLIASTDIYEFIHAPRGNLALRNSILTHAVSACFHILKTDYDAPVEDDENNGNEESGEGSNNQWKQFSNLVALSEWLENKGVLHWSDYGFDAVEVATKLYPIGIPDPDEGDE